MIPGMIPAIILPVTSVPEQLSAYYPFLIVICVTGVLCFLAIAALLRSLRSPPLERFTVKVKPDTEDATSPIGRSERNSWWMTVHLFVQKQLSGGGDEKLENLLRKTMQENAQLRKSQASLLGKKEAGRSEREVLEAKLRSLEAALIKERTIRQSAERRSSDFEKQLKDAVTEARKAYSTVAQPIRVFPSDGEEIESLKRALAGKDTEIARLTEALRVREVA